MLKSFDKFKPFMRRNSRMVKETLQAQGMHMQTLTDLFFSFVDQLVPFDTSDLCCTAGCGYCCHLRVTASLVEVVVIVDHLIKNNCVDLYLKRVAEATDIVTDRAGQDDRWWLKNSVPCIFHDEQDQICMIYEMRPFSCRGYHSLDLQLCKKGYAERTQVSIPCYPDLKRSREMYALVFAESLADLGYQSPLVELSSTVAGFLKRMDLMDRWFAGEKFLAAR